MYVGPLQAKFELLVLAELKKKRVATVADRIDAQAWVVDNPTAPGQRIEWLAAIRGGHVVSPEYVLSGAGPFLTFKRATTTRRWVWVSSEFAAAHPILAAIVCGAVGTGISSWAKVLTRDSFLAKIASSKAKRARTYYVIALVSAKEKRLDKDGNTDLMFDVCWTVVAYAYCSAWSNAVIATPAPLIRSQELRSRKCVFSASSFMAFVRLVSGRSLGIAGL